MTPAEIVKAAEAAYAGQDIGRVTALFAPDVVVYWDGRHILTGRDAVAASEGRNFASWSGFEITKTLRAASGDTIAVEWVCSFVRNGETRRTTVRGAEFWIMRDGLLAEWRAWSATDG